MQPDHHPAVGTGRGMFTGTLKGKGMPDETIFEIRVRDVLDEKWIAYFAPFTPTFGENETLLTGRVHDQAELFGMLLKIRDLGLRLVSVNPVAQ
jgi:hypothetical protein